MPCDCEYIQWMSEIQTAEVQTTVNVRKPNTFGFQTGHFCSVVKSVRFQNCLKSEQICSDFRQFCLSEIGTELFQTEHIVRISDGNSTNLCLKSEQICSVWNNSVLISDIQNCLKSEQICSDFRQKFNILVSKIRIKCSDFRHFCLVCFFFILPTRDDWLPSIYSLSTLVQMYK